jgi:hypothetical protein
MGTRDSLRGLMETLDGPIGCPVCDLLEDGRPCSHGVVGQSGARVHGATNELPAEATEPEAPKRRKGQRMRRGPDENRAHLTAGEDRCHSST